MKLSLLGGLALSGASLLAVACASLGDEVDQVALRPGEPSIPFEIASDDNIVAGEILRLPDTVPKTALIVLGGSSARTRDTQSPR